MRRHLPPAIPLVALVIALAGVPAAAQDTNCKTGNCRPGRDAGGSPSLPPECQQRASPRRITVRMESGTLTFVPANVRVEGADAAGGLWAYQCITWHKTGLTLVPWHSATDDTGGSSCQLSTNCATTANTTPPCDWETGNIDNAGASPLEFSTCHYRDVPAAMYSFQCRLHAASGMIGSLQAVAPIRLRVDKNAANDVLLDWSVGGIGPWDVFKDNSKPMPAPVNLTPGGTGLRAFTDPAFAGSAFYLVMERP